MPTPKRKHRPQTNKQPKAALTPDPGREPRSAQAASTYDLFPSWRLGSMEMLDRFGWHALTAEKAREVREKLAQFETMRWSSILVEAKKQNHSVAIDKLIRTAQDWLVDRRLLLDSVVCLRLSGMERVWGYLENGVFILLWWDPDHEICPAPLRHT